MALGIGWWAATGAPVVLPALLGPVLALVGFLATVALARFAERQKLRAASDAGQEGAP